MSKKVKIVMVSYLNAKPFEYGIHHFCDKYSFELITAIPSLCASLFKEGTVDVALLPAGALSELEDYKIISDYAIACDGEVRTVCIFSNQEIKDCTTLYLDDHSRTSVLLSKVILEQYLNHQINYTSASVSDIQLKENEAILMIGDKVFEYEKHFKYKYDLGSLWKEWTGLPFVFAVWVAKSNISALAEGDLNKALQYGVNHLAQIIEVESSEDLNLFYYFSHNIQYHMDDKKREALALFQEKVKKCSLPV